MIFKWSRIYSLMSIGVVLLVIIIAFLSYYQFIYPSQQEVRYLQEELEEQDQLIKNADVSKQEVEDDVANSLNLQRQLPIDKAINQLILNVEEIKNKTNSTITLLTNSEDQVASDQDTDATSELTKMNYQMEVLATNYDVMNQFLTELTNMDRIVEINNIEFVQTEDESIELSIGLTTFYNPTLTALQTETPVFEYDQEQDQDQDQEDEEQEQEDQD
ncbi:type 4a pilus biogenesis protein PilO [Paraliobacillus sediminis]|uniref:type 4a pilus biogenesis protein PilO n=1 Tax=Paraliobacillus sediminis TaxID=1885916 RepID=UPI000E3C1525|nr:type 4a pilus biogenesis protein PilO [Paraliobacillus sediminis]